MNINQAFPSKYLTAADIKGHPPVRVVISHYKMEEMSGGDKETKPVLYFQGKEKGVVLNITNANMIGHTHGPEFEGWTGKAILLRCEAVSFGGKIVDSIRVSVAQAENYTAPPQPDPAQQYAQEQQATAQTDQQQVVNDMAAPDFKDDGIPF